MCERKKNKSKARKKSLKSRKERKIVNHDNA
jgi:hypothetical protein